MNSAAISAQLSGEDVDCIVHLTVDCLVTESPIGYVDLTASAVFAWSDNDSAVEL